MMLTYHIHPENSISGPCPNSAGRPNVAFPGGLRLRWSGTPMTHRRGLLIVLEGIDGSGKTTQARSLLAAAPAPRPPGRLFPGADAGPLGPGDQAPGGPGRLPDAGGGARPLRQGPAGERRAEPRAGPGRGQGRRPRPLLFLDHRLPGGQGHRPRPDPPAERGLRRPARPRHRPRRRGGGGARPDRRPQDARRALRARGLPRPRGGDLPRAPGPPHRPPGRPRRPPGRRPGRLGPRREAPAEIRGTGLSPSRTVRPLGENGDLHSGHVVPRLQTVPDMSRSAASESLSPLWLVAVSQTPLSARSPLQTGAFG